MALFRGAARCLLQLRQARRFIAISSAHRASDVGVTAGSSVQQPVKSSRVTKFEVDNEKFYNLVIDMDKEYPNYDDPLLSPLIKLVVLLFGFSIGGGLLINYAIYRKRFSGPPAAKIITWSQFVSDFLEKGEVKGLEIDYDLWKIHIITATPDERGFCFYYDFYDNTEAEFKSQIEALVTSSGVDNFDITVRKWSEVKKPYHVRFRPADRR